MIKEGHHREFTIRLPAGGVPGGQEAPGTIRHGPFPYPNYDSQCQTAFSVS